METLRLGTFFWLQAAAAACSGASVRHRVPDDTLCCCGLLHLIRVFSLFIQIRSIFNVPLGSTVACTASIYLRVRIILYSEVLHTGIILVHLRKLRAHAEPRRAAARRGEAPLVPWYRILLLRIFYTCSILENNYSKLKG